MKLIKEDIHKIGNTSFGYEGYLTIICNGDTYGIESILLRNILELYGYEITNEYDWIEGQTGIAFETTFPWSEYLALSTD